MFGGWSKSQLQLIGVPWPPLKGWKYRVIGTEIPTWKIKIFIGLKDWTPKQREAPKTMDLFGEDKNWRKDTFKAKREMRQSAKRRGFI